MIEHAELGESFQQERIVISFVLKLRLYSITGGEYSLTEPTTSFAYNDTKGKKPEYRDA